MNYDRSDGRIVFQPDTEDEKDLLTALRKSLAASDNDDVLSWWTLDTPVYDDLDDDRAPGEVGERALVVSWGR